MEQLPGGGGGAFSSTSHFVRSQSAHRFCTTFPTTFPFRRTTSRAHHAVFDPEYVHS